MLFQCLSRHSSTRRRRRRRRCAPTPSSAISASVDRRSSPRSRRTLARCLRCSSSACATTPSATPRGVCCRRCRPTRTCWRVCAQSKQTTRRRPTGAHCWCVWSFVVVVRNAHAVLCFSRRARRSACSTRCRSLWACCSASKDCGPNSTPLLRRVAAPARVPASRRARSSNALTAVRRRRCLFLSIIINVVLLLVAVASMRWRQRFVALGGLTYLVGVLLATDSDSTDAKRRRCLVRVCAACRRPLLASLTRVDRVVKVVSAARRQPLSGARTRRQPRRRRCGRRARRRRRRRDQQS